MSETPLKAARKFLTLELKASALAFVDRVLLVIHF